MENRVPALKDVFSYKNLVHAIAGASIFFFEIIVKVLANNFGKWLRTPAIEEVEDEVDDSSRGRHFPALIAEIFREEGLSGLFKGWLPVVNSLCCSNFVYFYVFNSLKAVSYPKGVKGYPSKDLVLAYLAGVVNVLTTTPLWVANTRLKLQKNKPAGDTSSKLPHYTGMIDCLVQIVRQEGVGSLWGGTIPSLVLAANPAIHFAVYEWLKRYASRGTNKELGSLTYFLLGAIAKMIATVITYPLQVIQSRLRAGKDKKKHGLQGMYQTLKEIYSTTGVTGLYKGLETKLTQTVLMAALMFLTYEKIASFVFRLMRAQAMKKSEL